MVPVSWFDPIDAYCERTSASFWAEPLNAVSNLAFLLAAAIACRLWFAVRRAARAERRPKDVAGLALAFLVAAVGIGSTLLHTFANRWSALADVLPIAVFIHACLALALFRFGGLPALASLGATAAFFAASLIVEPLLAPLFGSSSGYVPALLALFGSGGWLRPTNRPCGAAVLAAGFTFLVSLALRTLDAPLCAAMPLGTHFLWHVLNALTLLILLSAAIRHGARTGRLRITV